MSVGLGSVLVLALYVQDEWVRDRQHPAAGYKYRIGTVATVGDEVLNIATSATPAVPLLRENFAESVDATRHYRGRFHVRVGGSDDAGVQEDSIGFADPNIGGFFSFEWRQGDPATAWVERNSIVLTEAMAQKYFPDGAVAGQDAGIRNERAVDRAGVVRDPALDSHLVLAAIAPLEALNSFRFRDFFESWFNLDFFSHVQLEPQTPIETIWPSMAALLESHRPETAHQIFDPALVTGTTRSRNKTRARLRRGGHKSARAEKQEKLPCTTLPGSVY